MMLGAVCREAFYLQLFGGVLSGEYNVVDEQLSRFLLALKDDDLKEKLEAHKRDKVYVPQELRLRVVQDANY